MDATGHAPAGFYRAAEVARMLRGVPGSASHAAYVAMLADLADRAELEGTPLLAAVTAERRRLNGAFVEP